MELTGSVTHGIGAAQRAKALRDITQPLAADCRDAMISVDASDWSGGYNLNGQSDEEGCGVMSCHEEIYKRCNAGIRANVKWVNDAHYREIFRILATKGWNEMIKFLESVPNLITS